MFQALKMRSLAGALKAHGNSQEAYAAVVELGKIGNDKAIDLLIGALARHDGVARAAARELGRLSHPKSFGPLIALLEQADVRQSAAEALVRIGAQAVEPLMAALKSAQPAGRQEAAQVLGEIGDKRALDSLIEIVQADDNYAVRASAATALGQLKDPKCIWVLVHTLRLRDETTSERQASLEELRNAITRALHKIGSPLAKAAAQGKDVEAALREMEQAITDSDVHPRLVGDLHLLTEAELVEVLNELIRASEEVSWAGLERREPMLAGWFKTYEKRAEVAQTVGKELHRRGGTALLKKIHEEQLSGYPALSNWWHGIGSWSS
jgi:HEAT repeats